MTVLQSYTLKLLLILLALCSNPSTSSPPQALPGCRDRCGDVAVPFPFGIGDGCFFDERFSLDCNDSASSAPKAYLAKRRLNVTHISLLRGELEVLQYVAVNCYEASGAQGYSTGAGILTLPTAYTVSTTKNKFTAIGCDTFAIITAYRRDGTKFTTGCMSLCDRLGDIDFGSCSGVGCCQVASIPTRLINISVSLQSFSNHTKVFGFNPCSYAVLAEESEFRFTNQSFQEFRVAAAEFPFILDWRIGDKSCEVARMSEGYACKGNSDCVGSKAGDGYLCQCKPGFEGNPYLPNGCQDVDECKDKSPCVHGTCNNTNGSFNCTCEEGYTKLNQTVCTKRNKSRGPAIALLVYVPLSVSIGLFIFVLLSLMLCWGHRKRKLMRQKEKFFEQNGGLLLQQRLSSEQKGSFETAKIFKEEELIRATNNYQHIVGEGGYGLVYKGILPDNKVVAIKKPKVGAQTHTMHQTEQFINEVVLLMQINHRNVVRLLGCCLDTEVPILVYEFITNGTLYEHIHKKGSEQVISLSWELRLKIATDIAGALAYLHSETNTPILHRDIKTMNILLDDNYTAKVSDFGTSRLIPLDQDELSTLVQGTIGYLDPEYLQSSRLTEKSDVYSFGVVLAELLTGKKAFSFDKSEGITNNLAMSFLSLKDDDHLLEIMDMNIVDEASMGAIKEVVNLTKSCLKIKGDERPTMKEVAMELERLRATSHHPWGKADRFRSEESAYLLGSPSNNIYDNYDLEYARF